MKSNFFLSSCPSSAGLNVWKRAGFLSLGFWWWWEMYALPTFALLTALKLATVAVVAAESKNAKDWSKSEVRLWKSISTDRNHYWSSLDGPNTTPFPLFPLTTMILNVQEHGMGWAPAPFLPILRATTGGLRMPVRIPRLCRHVPCHSGSDSPEWSEA